MNETRNIVVVTFLAFGMYTIGNGYRGKEFALPEPHALAGWALLLVVLLAFADIEATAELAAAFAWLVFLVIFLSYGIDLFDKINEWVGESK